MNQSHDLNNVIIFDGVCVLCNSLVDFLIKKDIDHSFKFLTAQSSLGQRLIYTVGMELQTAETRLIFIDKNRLRIKSDAVIAILIKLGSGYKLARFLYLVPRVIRDFCYQFVATRRYKWFGKTIQCRIPTESDVDRSLE
ncbi:uncharacterized protein METZ01_LOCUS206779 [marine metagenome]|jgi:predicted DCC family thiol-disulfide oxidoreductase YuxK|uniref:Thiol-disulfide oxidoreductase DCC n=1 Tax=marine metagenome TaxID=408172 RepID=A0A382ETZ8_9ZZZZ